MMEYNDRNALSTDYESRCGNCHSLLWKKDKYCRYCGTPVGEGAFKPYKNETYVVYGPPVKELWACPDCGYKWRSTIVGGDNAKYCPKCGSHKLQAIESVAKDMFSNYAATVDLDVVDLEHPQYLTPDEVDAVLQLRSKEPFNKQKAKKKLIKAGFVECKKAWEYHDLDNGEQIPDMTDREAERINMELFMLEHVKGDFPVKTPHVQCPKCKGNVFSVVLKKQEISSDISERSQPEGLYEAEDAGFRMHAGKYHCLLCDKYFD